MQSNPCLVPVPKRTRQAFTLIELLVVIAIIGVLVGVTLPIFQTVRNKGNQVKCLNLLKQWGAAISAYAGDNNQHISFYSGSGSVAGYMNVGTAGGPNEGPYQKYFPTTGQLQSYRSCPAYKGTSGFTGGSTNTDITYGFGRPYQNGQVLSSDPTKQNYINLTLVTHPSTLLLLIDTTPGAKNLSSAADLDAVVKPICVSDRTQIRHPGSVNILFADYHVENVLWTDMDRNTTAEVTKVNSWFTIE